MIDVKWSNGHVDHIDLQFVVEANKTYLLRAEEREPPRRPPKKGTPAEALAGAAAAGAIAGAAGPLIIYSSPIWLPIAIGYWIFAPAPDLPPVEHSIYVYITRNDGSAMGCKRPAKNRSAETFEVNNQKGPCERVPFCSLTFQINLLCLPSLRGLELQTVGRAGRSGIPHGLAIL